VEHLGLLSHVMAQVSQMFGEMVGAWVAHTWAADLGAPARLALVSWGVQRACIFEADSDASARSRTEDISREHFRLQVLCIPSLWLCVHGLHACTLNYANRKLNEKLGRYGNWQGATESTQQYKEQICVSCCQADCLALHCISYVQELQ
jgi:hypothetical protein